MTNKDTEVTNNFFLVQLAKSDNVGLRSTIAQHPRTPVAILELLARDEDKIVRLGIANNPNTSVAVLKLLARDKDDDVRGNATLNLYNRQSSNQ